MIPKTKFIIFGQGRSGSTLLKKLLNSHPEINCEGELLNVKDNYVTHPLLVKAANKFPYHFFQLRSAFSPKPIYGFTLLYYQIYQPLQVLMKLQREGWKFIHIYRNNHFLQSISHFVAMQTNFWHNTSNKSADVQKVTINPDKFLDWIKLLINNKTFENKIIENLDHIKIVYEDDLLNESRWEKTTSRIFEYLNTYPSPVISDLKKTYPRPYSEIVENYTALLNMVKQNNILKDV